MQNDWQDIVVWIIGGGILLILAWRLYARMSGRRSSSGCASCGVRECPHRRRAAARSPHHNDNQPQNKRQNGCPSH